MESTTVRLLCIHDHSLRESFTGVCTFVQHHDEDNEAEERALARAQGTVAGRPHEEGDEGHAHHQVPCFVLIFLRGNAFAFVLRFVGTARSHRTRRPTRPRPRRPAATRPREASCRCLAAPSPRRTGSSREPSAPGRYRRNSLGPCIERQDRRPVVRRSRTPEPLPCLRKKGS